MIYAGVNMSAVSSLFGHLGGFCIFPDKQTDTQKDRQAVVELAGKCSGRQTYRQTDSYRQTEHMYKSGIMLIFYFSQRGLLAWQKGNKNYSIKQLSFHIQIWLQPHKAGCIILLSNLPMEYSYWKYPEREIILRSFLSLVYFLLKKNRPCFPFLSWDNNYFRFAEGDLTADYECSLTTEGISALISNNRIKLSSCFFPLFFWERVFTLE